MKVMEEMVIWVVINGDYGVVLYVFIINLLVFGGVMVKILLDELLIVYKVYLLNFVDVINKIEEI